MNMQGTTKKNCPDIANSIGRTYQLDQRACEALCNFFLIQRRRDPALIMQTDTMLKLHAYVASLPRAGGR